MEHFVNEQEFKRALRCRLEAHGHDPMLIQELVAELRRACEVTQDGSPGAAYEYVGDGADWVIRDEHIDIVNDLATGGGVAFLVPIFFAAAPHVAVVQAALGVGIAAVRAIVRFKKNVAYLTRRQSQVVLALKAKSPLTVPELTDALCRAYDQPGLFRTAWDGALTSQTLQSLQSLQTRSGEVEYVVSHDPEGRWRLAGI